MQIEPAAKALATAQNFGALAVVLPNGQLLNHVMWVDATDGHVLINTEVHRAKYKAMIEDPDVTVTVWDKDDPYKYAEIRGRVVGEIRGDQARAHIDELSERYTGKPYANEIESERVVVKIEPTRQVVH